MTSWFQCPGPFECCVLVCVFYSEVGRISVTTFTFHSFLIPYLRSTHYIGQTFLDLGRAMTVVKPMVLTEGQCHKHFVGVI